MVKAYIFDLFGTLAYYVNGKGKLGEFLNREEHEHLLITRLNESKLSEERRKRFIELDKSDYLYLYKDSEQVINKLKKNYRLGIISNLYELSAKKMREIFNDFLKNFDVIAFSSELGFMKPDPKMFSYTLNKLGIKPEEAIMVGDKIERDIAPAQQLGMNTILIDRNSQTLEELI